MSDWSHAYHFVKIEIFESFAVVVREVGRFIITSSSILMHSNVRIDFALVLNYF